MDGCDIVVGAAALVALRETIQVAATGIISAIGAVGLGIAMVMMVMILVRR